jgi:glycosyltransferase involved in cell wall biosynthesis
MISIIMPVYNMPPAYIGEAVFSAANQTRPDWELILVNDGSTDDTLMCIQSYQRAAPNRISVISKDNGGVASAINRGVRAAIGEYVLVLSSDDKIEPTFLEKMVSVLEANPDTDIVGCDTQVFDASHETYYTQPLNLDLQLYNNQMNYCSLMRRTVFDRVGLFDENLRGYEDWEFWIRCAKAGMKSVHIPEFLFYYRHKADGGLLTECVEQHHACLLAYIRAKHPEVKY